jgi:hypothetical protein
MDDQARPVQVGLTQLGPFLPPFSFFRLSTPRLSIFLSSRLISEHLPSNPLFFPFFLSLSLRITTLRMRESNFAFPAQNRAAVCISSQLYDRRGAPFRALFHSEGSIE